MFRHRAFAILLIFVASLISVNKVDASIINAASCSNADVQTAINSAAIGDTVTVPAGSCTWSGSVSISGKYITLQGAGIDSTTVTGGSLSFSSSATNFVTVTGFTFSNSSGNGNGIIQASSTAEVIGFRVHHNKFNMSAGSTTRGVAVYGGYGVIDHNTFNATGNASIQSISVWGSDDSSDGGFTPWTKPLSLGTNKAVYIEDNTFTYSYQLEDSIDGYGGGRLVIRHNTFNNITQGFHGFDSGNRRSVHSFEIYNNIYINNSSTHLRALTVRGGTGVVYNNTYGGSGASWYGVTLMNYRSCSPLDQSAWGTCNGTNYMLSSTDPSSNGSRTVCTSGSGCNVKWCSNARDTMCTSDSNCSGGGTCSAYLDGNGTNGYACRDQVGRTTNQLLSPLYIWNNGAGGVGTYDGGTGCAISSEIMLNRDYYVDTAMPGYTAYTYPHPLALTTGARQPNPPVLH